MLREFAARRGQPIEVRAEWDERAARVHVAARIWRLRWTFLKRASGRDDRRRGDRHRRADQQVAHDSADDSRPEPRGRTGGRGGREWRAGARSRASWTAIEEVCEDAVPEFHKIVAVFGAPQIRHVGTIGGNIANASPIADSLPFLFVMEAELELRSADGTRSVHDQRFLQGLQEIRPAAGRVDCSGARAAAGGRRAVAAVQSVAAARPGYRHVHRRDPHAARRRDDRRRGIAFGAVGPTVIRARKTEAFLRGRPLDEETMRQPATWPSAEITPISDVRGAADYRYQLTRNVLLKFLSRNTSSR